MPSGPPELHEKWCALDPELSGDPAAQAYLTERGWRLGVTKPWFWTSPDPDHVITDEEESAIDYLQME